MAHDEGRTATLQASGVIGNSIAANTTVVTIPTPGTGKFKIWGVVRHTLVDGVKMTSPVAMVLPSAPATAATYGPIIVDLSVNTAITLALNTATGASDTASASIFAQRMD
jgi:hypothetical protein